MEPALRMVKIRTEHHVIKIEFNSHPVIGHLVAGDDSVVILVDRGDDHRIGRYATGYVQSLGDSEWQSGRYRDNLADAVGDLLQRAGYPIWTSSP